jgi:hypothetical protein
VPVLLLLVGLIATLGLLLRAQSTTRHAVDPTTVGIGPAVIYGVGSLTISSGYLFALEVPSGRLVGQFSPGFVGQGGIFVVSPDGQRGYLFVWQQLHELALPSLQLLHSVPAPNGINLLGTARVLAVAPDGQQVYLETMDTLGDPTSEYGIAVYDVATAAFTRQIALQHPRCQVGHLFALSNQRLAVLCQTDHQVRIVDVATGQQLPSTQPVNGGNAILIPVSQRLLVVTGSGQIQEVDLDRLVITRSVSLSRDLECAFCVPSQPLHLSSDGQRLTVVAAPGPPELRSQVNATVAWIVDTNTLTRVADVPVGPHTADAFELPDRNALVTSRVERGTPNGSALQLVEVPSGHDLDQWPGSVYMVEVQTQSR